MPYDQFGRALSEGDKVYKAFLHKPSTPYIQVCLVTKISEDGKVYLDNSKVALKYANRLIITKDHDERL